MSSRPGILRLLPVIGLILTTLPMAAMAQNTSSTSPASASQNLDQPPQSLDDGWATIKPSEAGFDPAALASLTQAAESGAIHNVHAVLVEHAGRLVYERYFKGSDERWGEPVGTVSFNRDSLHDLRSVSKSVTTALLGIALAGNYHEVLARPITSYFDDLKGSFGSGVEKISLQHVLTMTAGLEWNEMTVPYTNSSNDEIRLYYTSDPVAMVLGRTAQDPAGSKWYYNGGLSQVVAGLIRRKTGLPLHKFAEKVLFEPLGITTYEWLGSSAWKTGTSPSAASGLRMRARDLAKIGSVFLHKGVWKGRQVIPADWIDLSTQPHVEKIPWGRSTGTYGYGFMWYPGRTKGAENYRLIRAAGNGNQRIFILPDLHLAITVYAGNYNDYSHASDAKVLDHVLAARIQ